MHEKFRESWKAASYVATGLMSDFPNQQLEIVYHYRDRVESTICMAKDAGQIIEGYCRKFPLASVYYHGAGGYGMAAQIRCHCSHEKSKGCCKDGRFHRAKIMVSPVTADKNAPIA